MFERREEESGRRLREPSVAYFRQTNQILYSATLHGSQMLAASGERCGVFTKLWPRTVGSKRKHVSHCGKLFYVHSNYRSSSTSEETATVAAAAAAAASRLSSSAAGHCFAAGSLCRSSSVVSVSSSGRPRLALVSYRLLAPHCS